MQLPRYLFLCHSMRFSLSLNAYKRIFGYGTMSLAKGSKYKKLHTNSQSFARAKSEAKMAAHGGKFWTSVSVLFAVLYVSSSPLRDFNLQFLFGSTSKTFTTTEKCTDELLLDQFYIFQCLKGFIIVVWP